jgi:hypothetical protein
VLDLEAQLAKIDRDELDKMVRERGLVVHCKKAPYDVYIGRAASGATPTRIDEILGPGTSWRQGKWPSSTTRTGLSRASC